VPWATGTIQDRQNTLAILGPKIYIYKKGMMKSTSPVVVPFKLTHMKTYRSNYAVVILFVVMSCQVKNDDQFKRQLQSINLTRGEIALCASGEGQFGKVGFDVSCSEKVKANFNMATALLHSFEYTEAEKVFAKVIDEDPDCLMGYWGAAMSNFHPLWAPPTKEELEKGSNIIKLARTRESKSAREKEYLESVAALYDDWNNLDHKTRLLKFEDASEKLFRKYPDDKEAAIFYALALRAASDPADKTFAKQRKAGDLLVAMFRNQPDHPGIAHYLIHIYDYPELAQLALPAARKYASIASASAHALHMPSHIFTRLGLWDESVTSNINSTTAARCYAENSGIKGHWDEEIHGIDYLVYAYLQQGRDQLAKEQMDYLKSVDVVFPMNNKIAYTVAAVPVRYALERKSWEEASSLELKQNFPWENFPWERSLVSFARVLGAVHLHNMDVAKADLEKLEDNYRKLIGNKKAYEANQVQIQIKASEGWIEFMQGHHERAIALMTEAAIMEDATEKHPLTPGEVIPARELLGDMFMEMGKFDKALETYQEDLTRHQGRFNALYGAGLAAQKLGDKEKAKTYFKQLSTIAKLSDKNRPAFITAETFLKNNI
jgi:tetratricopeptide (TPR) repeat protein